MRLESAREFCVQNGNSGYAAETNFTRIFKARLLGYNLGFETGCHYMDLVKPFGYYFQICRDSFLQNPFLLHKSSHFILFAVETESLQTHKGTLLS